MWDRDRTIEARVGEEVIIDRASNPTTGFRWEARYDEDMLELRKESYERKSTRIGGGGTQVFRFVPLRKGYTTIHLCYKRPWESDMDQVVVLGVHVSER